jgi:hypothetical protein
LEGGALKKIAPSGGRRENIWGISCEKSRFYVKKAYFFQFSLDKAKNNKTPGSFHALKRYTNVIVQI